MAAEVIARKVERVSRSQIFTKLGTDVHHHSLLTSGRSRSKTPCWKSSTFSSSCFCSCSCSCFCFCSLLSSSLSLSFFLLLFPFLFCSSSFLFSSSSSCSVVLYTYYRNPVSAPRILAEWRIVGRKSPANSSIIRVYCVYTTEEPSPVSAAVESAWKGRYTSSSHCTYDLRAHFMDFHCTRRIRSFCADTHWSPWHTQEHYRGGGGGGGWGHAIHHPQTFKALWRVLPKFQLNVHNFILEMAAAAHYIAKLNSIRTSPLTIRVKQAVKW